VTTAVSTRGQLAGARPTAHLLSSIPTTRVERLAACTGMLILAYGPPTEWLSAPGPDYTGASGTATTTFLVVAAVGLFGLASTRFAIGPFLDQLRGEIFLPLFCALAVASTFWSTVPGITLRLTATMLAVTFVGYWLAVRFPLSQIIGLAAVTLSLGTVLQLAVIKVAPQYAAVGSEWVGFAKNRNVFGRSVSLAILVLFLASRIYQRYRVAIWVVLAMNVVMLVKADSKTSLVASAAIPAMYVTFSVFRARRTLYGAVAIVMGGALVGLITTATSNIGAISTALDRSPDLSSRTPIWDAVIPEIWKTPVFGHGWAGFFTDDVAGPARFVYARVGLIPHAHDALLNIALDLGLVGAALVLGFYLRLIVRGARVARYYRGPVGMFPLMYAGYVLLVSVTEFGVITNDLHYVLFVVAIASAVPGRRDELGGIAGLGATAPRRAAASSLRRRPELTVWTDELTLAGSPALSNPSRSSERGS